MQARAAEELQHALRRNIDSAHNVFTALFLTATALIISPKSVLRREGSGKDPGRIRGVGRGLGMGRGLGFPLPPRSLLHGCC